MSTVTIRKYPISMEGKEYDTEFKLSLPSTANIIHFQDVRGTPTIWCEVNPNARAQVDETFIFRPTSAASMWEGDNFKHIGTFLLLGGVEVVHLYRILRA